MMLLVNLEHARAVSTNKRKYCNKGIRSFFAKYGLDYRDFVHNGIDAEKLLATGDSMAFKAVEVAKQASLEV